MVMHSVNHKSDIILEQEFQKHLSNDLRKSAVIDKKNMEKGQVNGIGNNEILMCNQIKI